MLRAFVAMRIGDAETDNLLRNALVPVLARCGVRGIRIDNVEHNDDIDDRILRELGRADLIIADLTFARPSVYFEAGWGEGRGTPVIYTCRSDHFRPREDDEFGNLRVHFDLQMKNIIDWAHPKDRTFARRLEKRVRHVLQPIKREIAESQKAAAERESFGRLSVEDRSTRAVYVASRMVQRLGYRGANVDGPLGHAFMQMRAAVGDPRLPGGGDLLEPGWSGLRRTPGCMDAVFIHARESLTTTALRHYGLLLGTAPPHDMNPPRGVQPRRLVEHIVLTALRRTPDSRVSAALPQYERESDGHFTWRTQHLVPSRRATEQLLFIGTSSMFLDVPGLYRAVGYKLGKSYAVEGRYDIDDGYIVTKPLHRRIVAFPPTRRKRSDEPRPQVRVKARIVPRVVHLHVLDNVRSERELRERLRRQVGPIIESARQQTLTAP